MWPQKTWCIWPQSWSYSIKYFILRVNHYFSWLAWRRLSFENVANHYCQMTMYNMEETNDTNGSTHDLQYMMRATT